MALPFSGPRLAPCSEEWGSSHEIFSAPFSAMPLSRLFLCYSWGQRTTSGSRDVKGTGNFSNPHPSSDSPRDPKVPPCCPEFMQPLKCKMGSPEQQFIKSRKKKIKRSRRTWSIFGLITKEMPRGLYVMWCNTSALSSIWIKIHKFNHTFKSTRRKPLLRNCTLLVK
jgi:hypothetical protein